MKQSIDYAIRIIRTKDGTWCGTELVFLGECPKSKDGKHKLVYKDYMGVLQGSDNPQFKTCAHCQSPLGNHLEIEDSVSLTKSEEMRLSN